MASGPNVKGSMEKFLSEQNTRLTLVERRLAVNGGGGGNTIITGPSFMTPSSVVGGTFDGQTGRITLNAGATGVQVNGVFTGQYRAYKIYYGWYTGNANGLAFRLSQGGTPETAGVYDWSGVANTGNAAGGSETNGGTCWQAALSTSVGFHGELTVMEPMTVEYTNNQKRYVGIASAYGNVASTVGGIMGNRDTTPYDGFTLLNINAGPGVTATSGSWVMVVPVPTSQVSADGGGSQAGSTYVAGELEATFTTGGPARVRLRDGSLIGPLDWLGPYTPQGPRSVGMVRNGTTWQITGQTDGWTNGGFRNLALNTTGWGSYGQIQVDKNWNQRIGFTKLTSGMVVGSGLLRSRGTPAGLSLIGTIPPELRPQYDIILPVEMGDLARGVYIRANGRVEAGGGYTADQYLSLDGLCWWAADSEAVWTDVGTAGSGSSFGANFGNWTEPAAFGTAGYYKDRWGFTWLRGLVRVNVATSVDNTNIITLPASHRASSEQHYRATGMEGYAGFGARASDGLNWKPNSPGSVGNWISLNGAVITTSDALTLNSWGSPAGYANSWGNYGSGFPNLSWTRRGDGLVRLRGMMTPGTWNASVTNMVGWSEQIPRQPRIIIPSIANNLRARFDIIGVTENAGRTPGDIFAVTGNVGWVSFDSMSYLP